MLLLFIEVSKLVWSWSFRRKGVLWSRVLVMIEVNQSIFVSVFLALAFWLHRLKFNQKVSLGIQDAGKILIIAAVACEYIVLIILLSISIIRYVVELRQSKNVKNKKIRKEMDSFFWFIVYKHFKARGSVFNFNTKRIKETSLNTPDNHNNKNILTRRGSK